MRRCTRRSVPAFGVPLPSGHRPCRLNSEEWDGWVDGMHIGKQMQAHKVNLSLCAFFVINTINHPTLRFKGMVPRMYLDTNEVYVGRPSSPIFNLIHSLC